MRALLFIIVVLLSPTAFAEEPKLAGGTCYSCHLRTDDPIAKLWKDDVHALAGLGCHDCHGGDPTVDDNIKSKLKAKGFNGKIDPLTIPKLCGNCHSSADYMKRYNPLLPVDQLDKYWTSHHGQLIRKGDSKVAQCASCHHAHGIRKVKDAKSPVYAANIPGTCGHCHGDATYMKPYNISTKQYSEHKESVHGKALLEQGDVRGSPACNDCHGNHGAAPPDVENISHICGTCHSHNAELFLKSPMAAPFKDKALSECVACHGKHKILHTSDDWVGDQRGDLCRKCHKADDEGSKLARYFSDTLSKIHTDFDEIHELLEDAEYKGMDVTEGTDHLQAARQALIQTRTAIHAFTKPAVEEKAKEVLASQKAAREAAISALDENKARRIGLGISTIFLVIVTFGVLLLIRALPPTNE